MSEAKLDTLELIRNFLPKYLTPELQENLFNIVKEHFPFSTNADLIYTELPDLKYYYQGDGLIDVPFAHFADGKFTTTYSKGIILSNTCDISPDNQRMELQNIQFSTILNLTDYINLLQKRGISEDRIISFKNDLKANKISNLLYLPKLEKSGHLIFQESFVRFDSTLSLPFSIFNSTAYDINYHPKGDRIFSFSNYGFYLFLIKLSVHYCRFREGVFRSQ